MSPVFGPPTRQPVRVVVGVNCTNCNAAIELECDGLTGYNEYRTYNDFFCPKCRKLNHARTPGAIVSVRDRP